MVTASNHPESGADAARSRLAHYAGTKDSRLEAALLEDYRGLALSLARRYAGRGEAVEDLEQVAMFGLLKALRRFDPALGRAFSTFAVPTILGELKRHFRDHGWVLRPPRGLQELYLAVQRAAADMTTELGRSPLVSEIATRCGASDEAVLESLELGHARIGEPLEVRAAEGDEAHFRAEIGTEDPGFRLAEERMDLGDLLARLAPSDAVVLRMRYFDGLTQDEIAARLGTNQMAISRRLKKTVGRLQALHAS